MSSTESDIDEPHSARGAERGSSATHENEGLDASSEGRPELELGSHAIVHLHGASARVLKHVIPVHQIDPDAVKVVQRLTRYGHTAYLVGGCVRDLLLGGKPKDFDVATSARPNEVRSLFRNCRVIGRRFRLAHVLFGGSKVIEVATFRKDPLEITNDFGDDFEAEPLEAESDLDATIEGAEAGDEIEIEEPIADRVAPARTRGRDDDLLIRHDNVFGEPYEDAHRRDFTVNGLFYDVERKEVIDYVGGLIDVDHRVVRTIGLPDVRFREDPIRILRAIKFSARLDLGIEPDVYDAMVAHRSELAKASKPRLFEELLRLLRGGKSQRSIHLTWDTGTLHVFLPELASFIDDGGNGTDSVGRRLMALDHKIAEGRILPDPVLLAAVILDPLEEAMRAARDPLRGYDEFFRSLDRRLVVPRKMKDRIRILLAAVQRIRTGRTAKLVHREFYPDAMTLYELDHFAKGTGPLPQLNPIAKPELPYDTSTSDDDFNRPASSGRPRRRRRRF